MMLMLLLVGWASLSVPVAFLTGMAIRKGQRPIPAHLLELSPDLAPVPLATRS